MFVLFLNPRPQFRVKEHSDSVLPPLSPSAKHKNQNLHTYVTLILDLGGTGCQYSRESRADRPSHPPLLWAAAVPFGEPGGPEQAGAAPRERRRHNPPFSEGRQRPLGGAHSIPKAGHPGVSNSSPRERESWTRRGFPAGCGAPGTPVLLPGHLCAAHTRRGAPERHSRSVSSQPPGTQTTGRRIFSLTVLLLVRPFYVSFPLHYKHLHPSLSARGQKTSRTRDPQG